MPPRKAGVRIAMPKLCEASSNATPQSGGQAKGWPASVALGGGAYPSATSRNIMTAKPSMAPMVERSVSSPRCASGMSSSTTT